MTTDTTTAHELQSLSEDVKAALSTLRYVQFRLANLGYTRHTIRPDHGDEYVVLVHPDYVDVFDSSYDAFAGWDPSLGIPEWAVICP